MTVCNEVIITQLARSGSGKDKNSPCRILTQVYEKSGELIAEFDPNGGYSLEDMLSFSEFVSSGKGSIMEWAAANQRAF